MFHIKKHNLGESLRKFGVLFLGLTGAVTLCACSTEKQGGTKQMETQVDMTSTGWDNSIEVDTSSADKLTFCPSRPVANTIDVMNSPEISILGRNAMSILNTSNATNMFGDDANMTKFEEGDIAESKKPQAGKGNSSATDKSVSSETSKTINSSDLNKDSKDAVVSQENEDSPYEAANPTVNNSDESPDPNSDVKYSREDDEKKEENEAPDIIINWE